MIKTIIAGKKIAAFVGTGGGKTAIGIGALTELKHRGLAKKGTFIVPSIVRDQMGEEMARMLEPGTEKRQWLVQQRLLCPLAPH